MRIWDGNKLYILIGGVALLALAIALACAPAATPTATPTATVAPTSTSLPAPTATPTPTLTPGQPNQGTAGITLVYQASVPNVSADDMAGVVKVIERRLNAMGVSGASVQQLGSDRIAVQLPSQQDLEQVKRLIGKTAELVVKERTCTKDLAEDPGCKAYEDLAIGLTGDDLAGASASTLKTTGQPVVNLQWNARGTQVFADLTRRIAGNTRKRIAFILDGVTITDPTVMQPILDGTGFIEGNFTPQGARDFAIQLASGPLPVPLDLTGGGPAASPVSTPTPTSTATVIPTPTSVPAITPTPVGTPTPVPTLAAEPATDSARLLAAMGKVPLSLNTESVWFQDWAEALRIAGVTTRPTTTDLSGGSFAKFQPYFDAIQGMVYGSDLAMPALADVKEWQEGFGFNMFQFDLALYAGKGAWYDGKWKPGYYEGQFDAATVRQKLLALGYQEKQASGRTYYSIRGDLDISPTPPFIYAFSNLNRAYIDDKVLVAAPATAQIEGVLATLAGTESTLADDKAFATVAATLGGPLSAGMMPRQVAFDVSQFGNSQPKLERRAGWGALHPWDVLGMGYNRAKDGTGQLTFAIYYSDGAAASADAPELRRRLESYETAIAPELLSRDAPLPKHPFEEACTSPVVTASESGDGSVLSIRCQLTGTGVAWWMLFVDLRDIAFLVP